MRRKYRFAEHNAGRGALANALDDVGTKVNDEIAFVRMLADDAGQNRFLVGLKNRQGGTLQPG
jgi:hypothetical protein